MIWIVVFLVIALVILAIILWTVWNDKTVVTGGPTPEEAKITAGAILEAKEIARKADQQIEEIKNADRKTLFDLARAKLVRRK